MSKRSVAVEIAGQPYRIRSDADEQSLHRLAAYVDRAMTRVREGTGTVDSLDVAVLTCLNLAREILVLREQRGRGVEDGKLRALIERVESALPQAAGAASSPTEVPKEAVAQEGDSVDSARNASGGAASPAKTPERTGTGEEGAAASDSSSPEPPRTLELPSIETLRDRSPLPETSASRRTGTSGR